MFAVVSPVNRSMTVSVSSTIRVTGMFFSLILYFCAWLGSFSALIFVTLAGVSSSICSMCGSCLAQSGWSAVST